jgi:hypothetical protein
LRSEKNTVFNKNRRETSEKNIVFTKREEICPRKIQYSLKQKERELV